MVNFRYHPWYVFVTTWYVFVTTWYVFVTKYIFVTTYRRVCVIAAVGVFYLLNESPFFKAFDNLDGGLTGQTSEARNIVIAADELAFPILRETKNEGIHDKFVTRKSKL